MSRARRIMLFATVGATVALGAAQPAHAAADPVQLGPSIWAYTDSQTPKTAYVNQSGDAPLGTTVDAAGKAHTRRSYFTFDLAKVKGQVIHYAYLGTGEGTVTDCTASAPVELWRTTAITANTTWNKAPQEIERIAQVDLGANPYACPSQYVNIDFSAILNAALARGDKKLTVEMRVAKAAETDRRLGRTLRSPWIGVSGNHPPTVSDQKLLSPEGPCGTLAKHPVAGPSATVAATATDVDNDYPSVTFALWPADQPDQRREFWGGMYGNGVAQGTADLSGLADGTVVAWSARAADSYDAGPWGKTCYVTVDKTAPANAPLVSSKLYPAGTVGTGGPGVAGKFRFDAGGDRDVVAFYWRDWQGYYGTVKANRNGAGVLEYTPRLTGSNSLSVIAVDAAGNAGPERRYEFTVRSTAPYGSIDVAGVGLPSTITLNATVPETTAMSYQLPGAAEVKLPTNAGKATGQLVFPQTGYIEVTVRAYKGTKLLGQEKLGASVSDQPVVESAEFDVFTAQIEGKTGTFTFKPRRNGVVAYQYTVAGRTGRVDAGADGTAVLPYTADTPGFQSMLVSSVSADGTVSQPTDHYFDVIAVRPTAYASDLQSSPRRDGPGLPLEIQLQSQLPDLTGFVYRFNGGPEITVSTGGNVYAQITVTPPHAGANTLVVQAVRAGGVRSPETTYTFQSYSGPIVTWTPPGDVIVDHPVTLTFRSVLPGATQFRYSLPGAEDLTVPVGADGTATVTYTPGSWGLDTIPVRSVAADGTESETRYQYLFVKDNKVTVYTSGENWPSGGIGVPTWVTFYTQLAPDVVEFRYWLDDGPTLTVPAVIDGTSTQAPVTPTHNGLTTISVQQVLKNGEISPVTEARFLVGTATHVVSAQYPSNIWSGGTGIEGTFEFTAGTDGVVSFDYQFNYGDTTTVAAPDGHATITWTPTDWGQYYLTVTGHKADGSTTDQTTYYLLVSPS